MKKARKLITFILAAVMIMSMSLNVWAETGTYGETKGTITIKDPVDGITYSAYQILKLESYDTETKAYLYTVTDAWKIWLENQSAYIKIDENTGYVTWVEDADPAEFAQLAMNQAASMTPTRSVEASGGSAVMDSLELGYYLVDSNLGVLCSLDTTASEVEIEEKNEEPKVEKDVLVNSVVSDDNTSTASIGDEVKYQITITAYKGAENYTLYDTMSEGLTFNEDTLEVKVVKDGEDAVILDEEYELKTEEINGKTFVIEFVDDYLNSITEDTTIVVTYSATLNEKAVIAQSGNTNQTYLEYGNKPDTNFITAVSQTTTYTYEFDLVKYDGGEGAGNKLLQNAEFVLYESQGQGQGETPINLIMIDENTYRIAKSGEDGTTTTIVVADGDVTIQGLGNGTYYLKETKPPTGYNPTDALMPVEIINGNKKATVSDDREFSEGGIAVENNTGSLLPSTGGIGTTIFYIVGGVLVVFAVVLLVTKKRMKNEE